MKLSDKRMKLAEKFLLDWYHDSYEWKKSKGMISSAIEQYRFYRGIPYKKDYDFQTNYWKPLTIRAVETILPRLVNGLFATEEFFRYISTSDDEEGTKSMDNLTKTVLWKLYYETDFVLRTIIALKNALVYGWVGLSYPWCFKRKMYRITKDEEATKVTPVITVDAPKLSYIPIWNAYPQAGSTFLESDSTDGFMFREIVTKSELLARAKMPNSGYSLEAAKEIANDEKSCYPSDSEEDLEQLEQLLGKGVSTGGDVKKVELLHFYGLYDLETDSEHPEHTDREAILTLANRTKLVRATYNDLWCQDRTVQNAIVLPDTHGFMGIPIPQLARDVQLESNDMTNLRLDNYQFIVNKVNKVKRGSDLMEQISDGDILLYPGATIPVDEMTDLEDYKTTPMDPSSFTEQQILDADFDAAHGILDYTANRPLGTQRTATGVNTLISESNMRYNLMLRVLQPVYRRMMHVFGLMTQQLVSDSTILIYNKFESLNKARKETYKREDLQGKFYTLFSSSSYRGDKSYMFSLLQNLRTVLANDPTVNIRELNKQLFEAGELYNIDMLLTGPGMVAQPPGAGALPFQGTTGSSLIGASPVSSGGSPAASLARETGGGPQSGKMGKPMGDLLSRGMKELQKIESLK